jgi:16S rRNA processing protein RimM
MGVITGAHGIKGEVRVKSFTAEPEAIAAYGALEDERGGRRLALTLTGTVRGMLIARVEGVSDRNAAERLKGTRLYLSRARTKGGRILSRRPHRARRGAPGWQRVRPGARRP